MENSNSIVGVHGGHSECNGSMDDHFGTWQAVEFICDFLVRESVETWDENLVIARLSAAGFSGAAVQNALEWFHGVSMQGRLQDVIGFIQERNLPRDRVENPAESAYVSRRLWKKLERMRMRGTLNLETLERLLAGLRAVDSRDWDDFEICAFVNQAMSRSTETVWIRHDGRTDDSFSHYC